MTEVAAAAVWTTPMPLERAAQFTDGKIEPGNGQGKHALAGEPHYWSVPLKRWLVIEEV